MTLLHAIGRYRNKPFDDSEKQHVRKLVLLVKKIDLKTRLGNRSFIELANLFGNPNYDFLLECGKESIAKIQLELLSARTQSLEKLKIHKNYFAPILKYI